MNIKTAIERLRGFAPDTPCALSLWLPDDVRTAAQMMGREDELNDEEIADVLCYADHEHDANVGINWAVLQELLAYQEFEVNIADPSPRTRWAYALASGDTSLDFEEWAEANG